MRNDEKDEKDEEIVNERAVYGEANVQQYKADVAFKTLVEGVKDNLYVIPNFQRVYKWSEDQVEDLAISLIKGMPIPPIYTYRNKNNQLEILDGQQRVLSMLFYYIGKYTEKKRDNYINLRNFNETDKPFLEQLEEACELKNKTFNMEYYYIEDGEEKENIVDITYANLSPKVRRKLDYTTITVVEISIDDERVRERYLHKIFANLNSGGTPLTDQEIRNGIYSCEFYDMLFEFNKENIDWKELIGNEDNISRNIEYLLRLCAFKYFIELKGEEFKIAYFMNNNKLLNDFSQAALKFKDERIGEYRNSLEKFFSYFKGKIPKSLIQITLFECLFVAIDKKNVHLNIAEDILKDISKSDAYKATKKQGNASKGAIETKLKVVYDELQKYVK